MVGLYYCMVSIHAVLYGIHVYTYMHGMRVSIVHIHMELCMIEYTLNQT